jgi:hypothetical protein
MDLRRSRDALEGDWFSGHGVSRTDIQYRPADRMGDRPPGRGWIPVQLVDLYCSPRPLWDTPSVSRAVLSARKGELNPRDSSRDTSYAWRQLAGRRRGLFPTAAVMGDGKGFASIVTRLQSTCGDDLLSPVGIRSGSAAFVVAPPEPIRTYVGLKKTRNRLARLLQGHSFSRAVDLVRKLNASSLPRFRVYDLADHVSLTHGV